MQLSRKSFWMSLILLCAVLTGSTQPTGGEPITLPEAEADAVIEPMVTPSRVGWLELSGVLRQGPPRYAWVGGDTDKKSLSSVVAGLKRVASDDRYLGVVIYFNEPVLTRSQLHEIALAIKLVRNSAKCVVAFAQHYSMMSYLLACSADAIALQHHGRIALRGLGIEEMYLGGLLQKIGVQADLLQVGKFKGAAESLTRTGPSEPWSQNIDALLDDLYEQMIDHISRRRKLTRAQVEKALSDSWTLRNEDYVQRKLVDFLTDRDLTSVTERTFGAKFNWDTSLGRTNGAMQMENPFALFQLLFKPPKARPTRPTIALIHAVGPITSGKSSDGSFFGGKTIGSRTLVRVLRQVRDDPMIKGVALRLDSPGGSALASEVIWQAVRKLGQIKPVYVSIGSMAASGGYYIASGGEQIYAAPGSIIGSIGVVGGKLVLGGLYRKLGINVYRRNRGPGADMLNSTEPFTPDERTTIETAFQQTYELFTNRVSEGRGDRLPDLEAVAHGHIFTGKQATASGLVDKLGGIEQTVSDLAAKLGLAPGSYDIISLPLPEGLGQFFEDMFGLETGSNMPSYNTALLGLAKKTVGQNTWTQAQFLLNGLMLLQNETVLTLMPRLIVLR